MGPSLQDMLPSSTFLSVIQVVVGVLSPDEIVFTGGEPLLNKDLCEIIARVNHLLPNIPLKLVTNALINIEQNGWKELSEAGLSEIDISMHTYDSKILSFSENTVSKLYDRQIEAILRALSFFKNVSVNIVVSNVYDVASIIDFCKLLNCVDTNNKVKINLLNNIFSPTKQVGLALAYLKKSLGLKYQTRQFVQHTSRQIIRYKSRSGRLYNFRLLRPYYPSWLCHGCKQKQTCVEGFYGPRLEKKDNMYYLRFCAYKSDSYVLMPLVTH